MDCWAPVPNRLYGHLISRYGQLNGHVLTYWVRHQVYAHFSYCARTPVASEPGDSFELYHTRSWPYYWFPHPNLQRSRYASDLQQKRQHRFTGKQAKETTERTLVRPWLIRNVRISPTRLENAFRDRANCSPDTGTQLRNVQTTKCKGNTSDHFGSYIRHRILCVPPGGWLLRNWDRLGRMVPLRNQLQIYTYATVLSPGFMIFRRSPIPPMQG